MNVSFPHEISSIELVGGKGLHLQKLVGWGANVSDFFIITTSSFIEFRNTGRLPDDVKDHACKFLQQYSKIALRSSMVAEDHADASFAGLFETHLNVTKDNWENSLINIFRSVDSPRVKEYIEKKKIVVKFEMAVVVQAQVDVEKSGVLFTRSPIEPTSCIAIDAALGLGEGVVSGLVPVDHYLYTRTKEKVQERLNHFLPVLNQVEIENLIQTSIRLERSFGHPADIEWGIKDGQLYIFQIRPITRSFQPLSFFIDTNLSESYPGVVSPFTANFIKKAYENVFLESAIILGAHGKRLQNLSFHYARLISCVDNHLYYNLEHYYGILRTLPGGEKNIENWHKMIGGEVLTKDIPNKTESLTSLELVSVGLKFLKLFWNRKRIYNNFLQEMTYFQKEIESEVAGLVRSAETIEYLAALVNRPLGFGLTVVNDLFVMMGLGYLTKVCKKEGWDENKIIDLLKTSDELDSIKPLEMFNHLVHDLSWDFIAKFEGKNLKGGSNPYQKALSDLTLQGYEKEVLKLNDFLQRYGDRSFEELKLESLPLKNNPELLLSLIKWAKEASAITRRRSNKEIIVLKGLNQKVLQFTRDCISMREATRLWRGRFYHQLRQTFIKMVTLLQAEDPRFMNYELMDFFSISSEEWLLFSRNKISFQEVSEMMHNRKDWKQSRKNYPEFIHWVESERLPELQETYLEGHLFGQGVSPGRVEGRALVLDNPQEALDSDLKNFILVTKNTDPAWVYIMSRSLGLVSEKGSLLSHTAIIGRELSIPTVVGVKHATSGLKTGDRIRIDGLKGTVERL